MGAPEITVQHAAPPIYYCWKYWLSTGEVAEGCTDVNLMGESVFPDVNLYGWMYVVFPIALLFILIGLFYWCCRGKHVPEEKILDDPSILDEIDRYIEANGGVDNDLYTVVSMDGKPTAVPMRGTPRFKNAVNRLYPRLSAVNSFKRGNGSFRGINRAPSNKWGNVIAGAKEVAQKEEAANHVEKEKLVNEEEK